MLQISRFLIASKASWLISIIQNDLTPKKKELCLLQLLIWLNINLKTEVTDLCYGLNGHFGAAIMNLALVGFL